MERSTISGFARQAAHKKYKIDKIVRNISEERKEGRKGISTVRQKTCFLIYLYKIS